VNYGPDLDYWTFLDSNLHTRLAVVTENELGLAFPPRNLPKKFCPDPSTFYLVIVVTNRQTDKPTNTGKNIIPRFCGDNKKQMNCVTQCVSQNFANCCTSCTTHPEQIEVIELEGYSWPTCNIHCASSRDVLDCRRCNPQARPWMSFVDHSIDLPW